MAEALRSLGSQGALVVHCSGLDEIGLHDVTRGHVLRDGRVEPFALDPSELGVERRELAALRGSELADANAALLRDAASGRDGARSDVVALNAGAALFVAGQSKTLADGVARARDVMRGGAAERVLDRYVESTRASATKVAS